MPARRASSSRCSRSTASGELERLIKGQMDGIGTRPRLRAEAPTRSSLIDQAYRAERVPTFRPRSRARGAWLRETQKLEPTAVGHRVVHGGPDYDRPVLVDGEVLAHLERYVSLAPLHQPNNLAPIRALLARFPDLPQVACFDTAFHRGHSPVADHYAIPERFYAEGVRRYGFHGLSYEYIAERLREVAPDDRERPRDRRPSRQRRVDVRAVRRTQRRKHDGLHRARRAADGHAAGPARSRRRPLPDGRERHVRRRRCRTSYTATAASRASPASATTCASSKPVPTRALHSLSIISFIGSGCSAGMLAAALGGLDAFVFTAGIGENSPSMRARIAEKLAWLGVALDPAANAGRGPLISTKESRVALYVLPTDEELMIARHTLALLSTRG